ncbi:hypothetical protein [Nonomuraea insulae]|uniref:Minor tail protein n=1 Tax=Nonomuraea insulae TaxID=1616787 RepID=A0ABW1DCT7_9ACTN
MSTGRIYTVPWTGTVTNAGGNTDLWEISPADDLPCKIRGIRLGQTSELGDTAEESLRITIRRFRATVTSGSGGSSGAPEEVGRSNQTPSFAVEVNNTTVATTSGDNEVIEEIAWNIRNSPFEIWYPDPRFSPAAIQGEALLIRCESTVADDLTFAGTLWIEEG